MKTNVIVKLEIEGLHNWPAAEAVFPEVGFLSHMHRHKWFITAKKEVHHDDRDVEFIMFKRDIEEWLGHEYYNCCSKRSSKNKRHDFDHRHCHEVVKHSHDVHVRINRLNLGTIYEVHNLLHE